MNNQIVCSTLMNMCDDPTHVSIGEVWRAKAMNIRIPIFVTGNDFSTLYAPLIRDGRMDKCAFAYLLVALAAVRDALAAAYFLCVQLKVLLCACTAGHSRADQWSICCLQFTGCPISTRSCTWCETAAFRPHRGLRRLIYTLRTLVRACGISLV